MSSVTGGTVVDPAAGEPGYRSEGAVQPAVRRSPTAAVRARPHRGPLTGGPPVARGRRSSPDPCVLDERIPPRPSVCRHGSDVRRGAERKALVARAPGRRSGTSHLRPRTWESSASVIERSFPRLPTDLLPDRAGLLRELACRRDRGRLVDRLAALQVAGVAHLRLLDVSAGPSGGRSAARSGPAGSGVLVRRCGPGLSGRAGAAECLRTPAASKIELGPASCR